MKIICTKTSIEFTAEGFRTLSPVAAEHPLFSAPFSTLLELTVKWRKRELSEGESRVLFVALLNSSGKLVWKTAAIPPPEVVEKYMDYLLTTMNWKNAIGSRLDKDLPEIYITHSTQYLTDVGTWLSVWNNRQKEETTAAHLQSVRTTIAVAQEKLLKLLNNGREGDPLYLKHLYKWFSIAANVPKGIVEEWQELFLMERPAIWGSSIADWEEMVEHCEEHLFTSVPNTSSITSYAMATYRHICKQKRDCEEGVLGAIGASPLIPYSIIEKRKEEASSSALLSDTSIEEEKPQKESYSSFSEWLRAMSRWKLREIARTELSSSPTNEDTKEGNIDNDF